jgi:ureidoacrylate peracid hydrolase
MMREPLVRPLPVQKIKPHNTALLIIDMERDFLDEGAVQETPGGRALIPTINELSACARVHGVPVIFTLEMHRADRSDFGIELEYDPVHCLEGTDGPTLVAGLKTSPGDYKITGKRRYDSFHGTDLDVLLRSRRVENLVCCGVTTHVCVMSTVFTARHLDYRVLLPRDAVAAVSADHQAAALLCMSDVFAYITTSAEVRALWG